MNIQILIHISGAGYINALEETNTHCAQCADCTVRLMANKGLLWFPHDAGHRPPERKYICLNCAIKRVKKANYLFGIGLTNHNALIFNSIFLQYGGMPGILVGPGTVIKALCEDEAGLRKAFRLANIQKGTQIFQGLAKKVCRRWFSTKNELTWRVRGAVWRGPTARFIYRRIVIECLRPLFGLLSLYGSF